MFDILYSAIHLFNGLQKSELPGLIILTPPKKTARGRESDFLLGYYYSPNTPAAAVEKQQAWLRKNAESFYSAPGTVTSGMRLVIERLNSDLMKRNLDREQEGNRVSGSLSLAVLHRGMLFYTTLGSIRSFVITKAETSDNLDNETPARGLGTSQVISPKFQQVEIHANDLVLFSPAPPLSWTAAALAGSADLSIEALRRRLSNQAGPELKAALFRFVEGTGKALPLNLRFAQSEIPGSEAIPVQSAKTPEAIPSQQSILSAQKPLAEAPQEFPPQKDVSMPVAPNSVLSQPSVEKRSIATEPAPAQPDGVQRKRAAVPESTLPRKKAQAEVQKTGAKKKELNPSAFSTAAAAAVSWVNATAANVKKGAAKVLRRMLPGVDESSVKLSTPTMLAISIVVPLLVVAVGASFYDRVGRAQEFESYLAKAQQFTTQADTQQSDAAARLASLQQAKYWLDLAGKYGSSDDYQALSTQAQTGLDALNGIQRLSFSPALDPALAPNARISQMIATSTDLYLLDSVSGKVLRYFYAGSIFQKDTLFDCGPNPSPLGGSIGSVVDILALPAGNQFGATLLAVDAAGTIEYCIPGEGGMVNALNAPDAGWGKIQSIALSQGTLFVLDSSMNAVYRYEGNGIEFPDKPVLFFDEQIPALGEAIDIEINADELYILRSSGELVECTYSYLKGYKPTECQDPAPYGDMRAGQTPQAITFPEVQFIQMHMTSAPDSSLYLLDAKGKTIYHFSLQRNLQKVFLPSFENEGALNKLESTAFAVSPGRLIFVAFENNVQFTQLP